MDDFQPASSSAVDLTAGLVAAYLANNTVRPGDIAELISSVHLALAGLGAAPAKADAVKPVPAVSIKKSVTPDYLISLEDGKRYKSLKRHLSGHGLTPAEYRAKWQLASDYPMVAPNSTKARSEMAKARGFGRKAAVAEGPASPEPKKRGRKKAA